MARDAAAHYLGERREQIRSAAFQAAGEPIGSGGAESGNKALVQARLCGAGMRWAPAHVDPMLGLRTVVCADRWAEAWPPMATALRQRPRRAGAARRPARPAMAGAPGKAVPAVVPPPPTPTPRAPPPPARPKTIVNGRPTRDHPWKRAVRARPTPPTPALPKLCRPPIG